MVAPVSKIASKPGLGRDAQREQTRGRILDAVIEIVVTEGMRMVRHRAVADRAGVSLGSTTYHFSSIEELIISAFDYWRSQRVLGDNPFYSEIVSLLGPYQGSAVPGSARAQVAARIYELSVAYLRDQLTEHRDDRLVELAFYHESMRYPALRDLVMKIWQGQVDFLQQMYREMGSSHPLEDATVTCMLFRQLEQTAVLTGQQSFDEDATRRILHRHMTRGFAIDIPIGKGVQG